MYGIHNTHRSAKDENEQYGGKDDGGVESDNDEEQGRVVEWNEVC